MGRYVLDTNVLLEYPEIFVNNPDDTFIIHTIVASELDNQIHNKFGNNELAYKARQARNAIKLAENKEYSNYRPVELVIGLSWETNDDILLGVCKDNDLILYTNDLAMQIKGSSISVEWLEYGGKDKTNDYLGYKIIDAENDGDSLSIWYAQPPKDRENLWDLNINEYLLVKNGDKFIEKLKWTEKGFKRIKFDTIVSRTIDEVKPINIQQELLFDMLQDDSITIKVCTGGYGAGKDYCMLANAFQLLDKGSINKIIWVRNTVEVKNSNPVGFLKGDLDSKLMPYALPMADHVGGKDGLEFLIEREKVELQHLGFMRGRDIRDSIIYCSEAENMTKEHIQLLIGRIGKGSSLYLNGDFKQVDSHVFKMNNGLNAAIEKLQGHKNFGFVKLAKTERSETAAMADLLD